ncbi:MAG: phospholipase D-like domain-containing protein, partial [Halioglobus sp.]|nr:phospholipase D-like domain-containing protein [Halioglobus sp.]
DVRIIIPERTDSRVVTLANWSFTRQLLPLGIKIYRYREGFMHQKVLLMDERTAGVGTANCDNRSFRLNFEVTLLVEDAAFAKQVQLMLETDMGKCHQVNERELNNQPLRYLLAMSVARLFAPLL